MLSAKDRPSPILPGLQMKQDAIAGRYRVERLLGAGSSGFVVVARHAYLHRRVTLKILTSMSAAQQRAQRRSLAAAHAAATLRGRHVARIVDTGFTEEGLPFIATEELEGRTLFEELKERRRLPVEEAVCWSLQACEALAEAHANGIVHGDLKPQNLFLAVDKDASDDDHEERLLKVLDFGMSAVVGDEGGDTGDEPAATWSSSPAYLAPERIQDPTRLEPRVDVWALGVILYELMSGRLPFSAESVSGTLIAVMHREPDPLAGSEIPPELAAAVHQCLAKDPAARPADMVALARMLAPFAGSAGPVMFSRVASASTMRAAPPAVEQAPSAPPDESFGVSRVEGMLHRTSMRPVLEARRRRRNRLAKIGAAVVLVGVAIFASPSSGGAPEKPESPPVPTEEVMPAPFVPHSFEPAPERPPTPKHAGPPAYRWSEAAPRAQIQKTPQPAAKPRATLSVRENPYGSHSQRPPAHRNHPR